MPPLVANEWDVRMSEVTIYTTGWCPYCRLAKAAFERQGVPFREVNIERDPELGTQVEQWNGGSRTVPTFQVGDQIVTYKQRARLRELIGVHFP